MSKIFRIFAPLKIDYLLRGPSREKITYEKLRILSKSELAWQYCPDAPQITALHRLSRWIKGDSELYSKLKSAGYRDSQRLLTPQQVKLIYEYLGEPEDFVP